ncbi:MAG: PAS domain S-box protein, partial [Methanoregula sp.]|nr:PAS domain S-box protein [Methanoregula sp.]
SPAVQEIMGTIAMKAAAEIERLRIERALRESEGKFRTLVENSLDGILIVDLTGKILFRNRAAVNIVDAVIKPDRASTKNVLDFIAPESRAQVLHDFSQVASGIDSFPMNYQVVTSTGKKIWVESIGKQIVFHDSPAAIVSLRDITDRKLAEEALRESREKFRSFVENANEIVFSLTPDGIISYVSPKWTEFMGDDTGELIGKPASGFIHPDDIPQCRELFLRTINTGESGGGIEYRVRHKNGTWLWHTLSGSPIRDTGGDVVAYLGICHDITERRKIENALRQANKKLNLLSSINRHDINNQLMVLNGFVELLHKKVPEPTFEYYFSSITKASNQIMSMIQFTKEYEKIGVRAPVWHDLRALVKNSAEGAMLGEVTLKNDLPADTEVFFDPLIVKVFFNLIDNALRHGRGITAIRFFFETRNGDRIIICEDDGTGISTGEKEKIFDLGFGKNTGFGLAISREILDITGISIRETGVPGRGARFEIIVPEGAYRIRAGR